MNELYKLLSFAAALDPDNIYYQPVCFLIDHLDQLPEMTIYDVAERSFVSTATISRLTRLLGYRNYQELRVRLYASCSFYRRIPDVPGDVKDTVGTYLNHEAERLELFRRFAAGPDFEEHVEIIRRKRRIIFYTPAGADIVLLLMKLVLDGKQIRQFSKEAGQIVAMSSDVPEDLSDTCIIEMVHVHQEYEVLLPLIRKEREQGAAVIIIAPQAIQVQKEEYDQVLSFPLQAGTSDAAFYAYYTNSILYACGYV